MSEYWRTAILAPLLILYGVFKMAVFLANISLSKEKKALLHKNPVLHWFISFDESFAGKFVEIVIAVFGVFTIIHGLNMIVPMPAWIQRALFSQSSIYFVHSLFGALLVVFYGLVIFSNVNIPKDMTYRDEYIIKGFCSGLVFLVTIPIVFMYRLQTKHGLTSFKLHTKELFFALVTTTVLALSILYFVNETLDLEAKATAKLADMSTSIVIALDIAT
jgi:hypothetical protein